MGEMKILTNNVPRFTIDAFELTPAEREQFDYLDWAAIDEGNDSATFVRYKGELYDLGTFTRTQSGGELAEAGWEGINSDSFSSGTILRWAKDENGHLDPERVIVGRVYS